MYYNVRYFIWSKADVLNFIKVEYCLHQPSQTILPVGAKIASFYFCNNFVKPRVILTSLAHMYFGTFPII